MAKKRKNSRQIKRPRTRGSPHRLRDLANVKATRPNRTTRHANGALHQGVAPAFRSVLKNGRLILITRTGKSVDMRTVAGRRFRDVVNDLVADLGGGSQISTAELSLICRAATLELDLGFQEAEYLQGNEKLDPAIFTPMAKLQMAILHRLGLRRRAREIGKSPSLQDIRSGRAKAITFDAEYEEVE